MTFSATNLAPFLEELAANAWPPLITQRLDGWQLGFSYGATRRANSILPNEANHYHDVLQKIVWAEQWYARHGLPACYKLSPAAQPANLAAILAERGYISSAPTQMRTATVSTVLRRDRACLVSTPSAFRVQLSETFDPAWNVLHGEIEREDEHTNKIRGQIFQQISQPCAYITLFNEQNQPAAIGVGVAERGWVGIFGMATLPQFRRQGAASQIIRTLAEWGEQQQAKQLYLQVMSQNETAQAVYARLGFEEIYRYFYCSVSEVKP